MKIIAKSLLLSIMLNSVVVYSQSLSKSQEVMQTDQTNNDKSQILDVTRHLTELMIDRNTEEMNKILDSHFTLTHMTGYVQPKEGWFSEIASERMKYYSYKEVKTSVKMDGDNATFVSQIIIDARIWGSRNNWRLQQTMQLEKRSGKWIILKSIATTF